MAATETSPSSMESQRVGVAVPGRLEGGGFGREGGDRVVLAEPVGLD